MNLNEGELHAAPLPVRLARGQRTNSPGLRKFEELASQKVRFALAQDDVSLKELSRRLSRLGIEMDNKNLSRKIKQGKFSAALLIAMLQALGVTTVANES